MNNNAKKMTSQAKERELVCLMKSVGKRYENASFANYVQDNSEKFNAVESLFGYAEKFTDNLAHGNGVVLFGTAGTGKKHLMVALARKVIDDHFQVVLSDRGEIVTTRGIPHTNFSIHWLDGMKMIEEIREGINDPSFDEYRYVNSLIYPSVLIISDPIPPAGNLTDHQISMLYYIIDGRYAALKPTWVSMNVSNAKEADEKLTPQIVDRMIDGALAIYCGWGSYRKAQL